MALTPGTRLGAYEVLALLGSGGMGEVYRARDTRLDRTVAIKILRDTHSDLETRFARESKAIAALTHPHICMLFDIGHDQDTDYLFRSFDQLPVGGRPHVSPRTNLLSGKSG